MNIESIHIYPIKGLSGISLEKAYAKFEGFENDRRWMLIDENGKFLTQRAEPKLALFKVELVDESFISICYNDQCVGFDKSAQVGDLFQTEVWGRPMSVREVDSSIGEWFSDMLGRKCRLVKLNEDGRHIKKYAPEGETERSKETKISFADGYPYLIAGTGSLEVLNSKLETPLPMNRFRPNIVLKTIADAEEDTWTEYEIGKAKFRNVKSCIRCNVTTIDQELGKVVGKEPLKTLSMYRRSTISKNEVIFGVYAVLMQEGWLEVSNKFPS